MGTIITLQTFQQYRERLEEAVQTYSRLSSGPLEMIDNIDCRAI